MNSPKRKPAVRWLYVVYIVGIATLAVSMVGASWMLRGNAGTNTGSGSSSAETTAKAYCVGNVDVEGGMMFPYPSQPGRVVEVKVSEGQKVSAGDVLFRMDDRREREDLKAAEEAVKAAEETFLKANNLKEMHALKVEGQSRAIAAAKHDLEAARSIAALKKRLAGQSGTGVQKEEAQAAEDKVRAAEELVGVEEAKLAAVKLEARDIDSAIRLADIDLLRKKNPACQGSAGRGRVHRYGPDRRQRSALANAGGRPAASAAADAADHLLSGDTADRAGGGRAGIRQSRHRRSDRDDHRRDGQRQRTGLEGQGRSPGRLDGSAPLDPAGPVTVS